MTAPEMKALLCDEPGKLTCVTRLRPEDKPGHLRIRIEATEGELMQMADADLRASCEITRAVRGPIIRRRRPAF